MFASSSELAPIEWRFSSQAETDLRKSFPPFMEKVAWFTGSCATLHFVTKRASLRTEQEATNVAPGLATSSKKLLVSEV